MNKEEVIKPSPKRPASRPMRSRRSSRRSKARPATRSRRVQGVKTDRATLLAGISQRTGIPADTCDKVLTALEGTVSTGISEKLGFLKGLFTR